MLPKSSRLRTRSRGRLAEKSEYVFFFFVFLSLSSDVEYDEINRELKNKRFEKTFFFFVEEGGDCVGMMVFSILLVLLESEELEDRDGSDEEASLTQRSLTTQVLVECMVAARSEQIGNGHSAREQIRLSTVLTMRPKRNFSLTERRIRRRLASHNMA